uniref:Uncharacterized protein n=1 Tax=Marseillevirus LCMAC201 TaxID=2506605 RepID=A0A481YX23_9VIRU|nr:MAG: uncharacterized protein LCMAC201_02450 [Marseillevirus LCMAC201]
MTETYGKSADFGGQLAPGQLHPEIVADPGITTTLLRVDVNSDVVDIVFQSTISGSEKTALDAVVSAHTPAATNSIDNIAGYIELNSSLADAGSIRIVASNAAGGIDVDAGTGGIAVDTTNAISLDAAAASNFTTTTGNLTLDATAGLVNIDGGSGINIGTQAEAVPINIGTAAAARTITIGNTTGASGLDIDTGTGGFIVDTANGGPISLDATGTSCNFTLTSNGDAQDLTFALVGANNSSIIIDSQGTGSDAIRLNSGGGIDTDASGQINFVSSQNAGGAVTIDTATGGGGITFNSGSFGILMTVAFGGSCNIGDDTGTGDINLGTGARERDVSIGSTTTASSTSLRWGTGALRKYQPTHTSLSDAGATLTIAQLKTGILSITPTIDRTLTMPTAALSVTGLPGMAVDDSIEVIFINNSTPANEANITIAMGTGGTLVGNDEINPKENQTNTYKTSGSATYRMRFTNVTAATEAYTLYRIS